ncbi:TPA: YopX family protein [Campylobacter jejuni]
MKLQDFDFRIWDGKKYINNIKGGVYIHKINDHIKCLNRNQDCYNYEFELDDLDNSNLEIELFTGLYDKNGKKIYEGDILRIQLDYNKVEKGFVQYHNGIFKVINRKASQASHEYCVTFLEICYIKDCVEIIGNIHENTELLK